MKFCARTLSRATKVKRDGAVLGVARKRARKVGDDEGVKAFGRAGASVTAPPWVQAQREGERGVHVRVVPAWRSGARRFGKPPESGVSYSAGVGASPVSQARRSRVEAYRANARLRRVRSSLKVGDVRVGEGAEGEVHLAKPPPAAAK